MNTAALVTNQHTPVHRGPARLCEGWENHSKKHDTCSYPAIKPQQEEFLLQSTDLGCEFTDSTYSKNIQITDVLVLVFHLFFFSAAQKQTFLNLCVTGNKSQEKDQHQHWIDPFVCVAKAWYSVLVP